MSRSDTIGKHKTLVYLDYERAMCVKYHNTVVARLQVTGKITLNSGGYRTATTKVRMNQALRQWGTDYYVQQVKGVWGIRKYMDSGVHARVCLFHDGITLQ